MGKRAKATTASDTSEAVGSADDTQDDELEGHEVPADGVERTHEIEESEALKARGDLPPVDATEGSTRVESVAERRTREFAEDPNGAKAPDDIEEREVEPTGEDEGLEEEEAPRPPPIVSDADYTSYTASAHPMPAKVNLDDLARLYSTAQKMAIGEAYRELAKSPRAHHTICLVHGSSVFSEGKTYADSSVGMFPDADVASLPGHLVPLDR